MHYNNIQKYIYPTSRSRGAYSDAPTHKRGIKTNSDLGASEILMIIKDCLLDL